MIIAALLLAFGVLAVAFGLLRGEWGMVVTGCAAIFMVYYGETRFNE